MSEQVQLTGHEQDVLNSIIKAGGSVAGFSFAEQSSVDVLQSLVSKGAVYLQGGRVHAAKFTLDLAAENARLAALVSEAASYAWSVIDSYSDYPAYARPEWLEDWRKLLGKLGEKVEESED